MVSPIRDEAVRDDFTAVAVLGQKLRDVISTAAKFGPAASLTGLARRISREVGASELTVRDALSCLWNLGQLKTRTGQTADNLLQPFVDQFNSEWLKEHKASWSKARPVLVEFLDKLDDDHPIFISIKANQLAYAHEHLLLATRLVTDIRPVFDSRADKILETVITHTLTVQYTGSLEGPAMISFVLDIEDVKALGEACERAIKKAEVVLTELKDFKPVVLPES